MSPPAGSPQGARPIYLDHNATTPVDARVLEAMLPFFMEAYGNPSSVEHHHGNEAAQSVRYARQQVAAALGARENEIIFTGSCTEANNMAILGAAKARPEKRHHVTTAIEHPAVLEPFRELERQGHVVTVVGVDEFGRVSPDEIAAAIRPDTGVVSVMGANNEVGTIQPIAEIGAACAARNVLFHSDLAQVMAHRIVNVQAEHIHLASISGHKAYGPKGVGALYVRSRSPRARMDPISFGGGQEKGLRSGTLNVPLIVALGEALAIAHREGAADAQRLKGLGEMFTRVLADGIQGIAFNGHPSERLPGMRSVSIRGVDPLALMHRLNNLASFSASSACASEKVETSHVLLAMFGDGERARSAFRVSPGRSTKMEELRLFGEAVVGQVAHLRQYSPSG